MSESDAPKGVDFLVFPTFQLTTLSLAIEMLRLLNRSASRHLLKWRVFSDGKQEVAASNGLRVTVTDDLSDLESSELLFVCASFEIDLHYKARIGAKLRRLARSGTIMGGLDTGAFVLAKAGLLDGRRATLHWESVPLFREMFPSVDVTYKLFEIDRDRITSPGNLATFDLFFHLIMRWFGREPASAVAELMIHEPYGKLKADQRPFSEQNINLSDPRLRMAVSVMNDMIDDPITTSEIARRVGISVRQLIRLFIRYTGRSPHRFYFDLRLQYARRLLADSQLKITDVATACGFTSISSFSHAFRRAFGSSPKDARRYDIG